MMNIIKERDVRREPMYGIILRYKTIRQIKIIDVYHLLELMAKKVFKSTIIYVYSSFISPRDEIL
jgi:hypothetical protein